MSLLKKNGAKRHIRPLYMCGSGGKTKFLGGRNFLFFIFIVLFSIFRSCATSIHGNFRPAGRPAGRPRQKLDCLNDQAYNCLIHFGTSSGAVWGQLMGSSGASRWRTTSDGRRPLTEDDLWRKTTFDARQPLTEYNLRWKTTFERVYSILPEKNVYDPSPWQSQHNWPQTGNPISCLNRK